MDAKNMIGMVVAIAVGIIMIGPLVAVISDAQTDLGDPTTKTNDTAVLLRPVEAGDVLAPSYVDNKWVWTLNGEVISGIGNNAITWDSYIISDAMYLSGRSAGDNWAATISIFSLNPTVWSGYCNKTDTTANITFGDGEITVTGTNSNIYDGSTTFPYSWAYVVCPEVDATYCSAVAGGSAYVKSTNDLILCGTYSTGENDCAYTLKNGVTNIIGGDYSITVNQTLDLADGTTDIYTDTVTVDISDESFTPFRLFVPYEVHGHATSGSMYDLLGVIPLLITVGLIVGIVGAVFVRRLE